MNYAKSLKVKKERHNMKTVEFPCYTNFGGCDSADWEIEVELTDEEYSRLELALKDIDIEYPEL